MNKIASPTELQAELRSLVAHIQAHGPEGRPDRQVVAAKLRDLADRVAAAKSYGDWKVVWQKGSRGSYLVKGVHPEHGSTILFQVLKDDGRYIFDEEDGYANSYRGLRELKRDAESLIKSKLESY